MGCLTVNYERDNEAMTVSFALECGTSIGIPLLFDVDGRQLFDADGKILIANY